MTMSTNVRILVIILGLYIISDVLLTPVGFETRAISGITTLGFATLALIFLGLALIVASLVLLRRNASPASTLAMFGLLLYFPAFIADRTGIFASTPSPGAITVVEIVQAIIALAGLVFAWMIRKEKPVST